MAEVVVSGTERAASNKRRRRRREKKKVIAAKPCLKTGVKVAALGETRKVTFCEDVALRDVRVSSDSTLIPLQAGGQEG